jgi:hypothetical protein
MGTLATFPIIKRSCVQWTAYLQLVPKGMIEDVPLLNLYIIVGVVLN